MVGGCCNKTRFEVRKLFGVLVTVCLCWVTSVNGFIILRPQHSVSTTVLYQARLTRRQRSSSLTSKKTNNNKKKDRKGTRLPAQSVSWNPQSESVLPKLVVFDLDGCLWKPELYELAWRGEQSPFVLLDKDSTRCVSQTGSVLKLVQDAPAILERLHQVGIPMAISSRCGKVAWARELLSLLTLPSTGLTCRDVIGGPWEIVNEPKTEQFHRIADKTGIPLADMVFFDNERGNCLKVAKLGVTVGYCPQGLTTDVFERTMQSFPRSNWDVIGIDL